MKRIIISAFLFFAFVYLGFSQTDNTKGSGNDEVIDEYVVTKRNVTPAKSHNFGIVTKGSVVEHQFKVVNSSLSEMNITKIEVPQGIEIKMDNKTLQGKSETTFTVVVNTKNFDKSFQGVIILKTDNPKTTAIKYTIEGILE